MSSALERTLPEQLDQTRSVKPKRPQSLSYAAKLNSKVLGQLQRAFEADPEIDLTTVLPKDYSVRLERRKGVKSGVRGPVNLSYDC